jgi:hypothetical protein
LENIGKALHYQSLPPYEQKCRIVSSVSGTFMNWRHFSQNFVIDLFQFSETVSEHHSELFSHLCSLPLTRSVLKILSFVPLKLDSNSSKTDISLLHTATHCLVHTLFLLIQDQTPDKKDGALFTEEERNAFMVQIVGILVGNYRILNFFFLKFYKFHPFFSQNYAPIPQEWGWLNGF